MTPCGTSRRLHPLRHLRLLACVLTLQGLPHTVQAQAPTAPAARPLSVEVQGYEVEGNTLLPAAQIQARLSGLTGARTMVQLRDAAAAVQELYRRAGYGGVVAFLPEQNLQSGRVKIRIVEGRLQRIEVTGNQHFSRDNVQGGLPALRVGETPEVRRIDAQIQMINENPAKQVQVLLQPGSDPASIAAKVTVNEGPIRRGHLRLDNTGGDRTGRYRLAGGWQHADLTGRDDVLNLEAASSPGHWKAVRVVSAGYRLPFYDQAMVLDGYALWSDVDGGTTQTAAGDLAFSGKGRVAGLRLSRYLQRRGNVDQRFQLGFDHRDYLNDCAIAGLPAGACGSAGVSVRVQPLMAGYTLQAAGRERVAFNAQLVFNPGWGGQRASAADFDSVRSGAKPRYAVVRMTGSFRAPLEELGHLELRGSLQWANRPLIPGEAFGLGGAYSLRGFEERELIGDGGLLLGAEAVSRNLLDGLGSGEGAPRTRLQLLAFIEGGFLRNRDAAPCQIGQRSCRMGAVGVGLRAAHEDTTLRLDLGRAMSEGPQTRKGDLKAHLLLTQSL
ncbi:MAG: ShlB/FhaC/HecB family hemolysin secretion/activation protein [Burkholderiales bacterium]|nr:ShlB/FhaC/HecB family hemolysin secretion/activation protein [Burkholderiales bacterium]